MVETKNNEIRYFTSDPKKMLNKYLAQRVLKTWTEDFIDEDTILAMPSIEGSRRKPDASLTEKQKG